MRIINACFILGLLLFFPSTGAAITVGNLTTSSGAVWDISAELYLPYGATTTLPTSPSAGAFKIVTDSNGVDCSGGGSQLAICVYNGTAWVFPYAKNPSPSSVVIINSTDCSSVTGAAANTICYEYTL